LRLERERRGLALKSISESTKLSVALLEGLESDDISRWPGGIFRRAFVRSYAQCVGLDQDDVVRRFEAQFPPDEAMAVAVAAAVQSVPLVQTPTATLRQFPPTAVETARLSQRARIRGTAADLGVALVLAFGFAAAGSRLLWPVVLIACYYAVGVLLTGTSPMVALLSDIGVPSSAPEAADDPEPKPARKSRRERATRRESGRRSADRGVATTQDAQVRI
jgi:Helix-turn-helix domain